MYYPSSPQYQHQQPTQSALSLRCDIANAKSKLSDEHSNIKNYETLKSDYDNCIRNPTYTNILGFTKTKNCESIKNKRNEAIKKIFTNSKSKSISYIDKVISNPSGENLDKFACYLSLLHYSYEKCGGKNIDTFIKDFVAFFAGKNKMRPDNYIDAILKNYPFEQTKKYVKDNGKDGEYKKRFIEQLSAYSEPTNCTR